MDRNFVFAVAALTLYLVLLYTGKCDATRPLKGTEDEYSETSSYALPPTSEGTSWQADMITGAGKWLPMPSGMHFPSIPGTSIPWMALTPPAFTGPDMPLVPPYVGATRQEQLSMWAQLFNPLQRPRLPIAEPAGEPKMSVEGGGGTAVGDPSGVQIGEPKWSLYLGNGN